MEMQHGADPKQEIRNAIGDISDFQLFGNEILVAIYIRPQDRKSTRLNSSHTDISRMPSSA